MWKNVLNKSCSIRSDARTGVFHFLLLSRYRGHFEFFNRGIRNLILLLKPARTTEYKYYKNMRMSPNTNAHRDIYRIVFNVKDPRNVAHYDHA